MCKTHDDVNRPARGRGYARRMAALGGSLVLAAMIAVGWSIPGHAAVPQDDPFAGLEVLEATEMAEKRGGFFDAALGISLNLAANILTTINGQEVLQTNITFVSSGPPTITQTPASENLTGLTFLGADGSPIAGIESQNFPGPVTFTANGTQVTVPAGFQGLVAKSDTGGVVAAVNKITSEQFASLVVNANAEPLSAIKQELNINIDVNGFAGLQESVRLNAALSKFRDAMRSASLGALGAN